MQQTNYLPKNSPISEPRWACFNLIPRPGRERFGKIPVVPGSQARARSNDSSTWRTWHQAWHAVQQHQAHGVLLALVHDDDLFALDLDDVLDEHHLRIVDPVAEELFWLLGSYTELSPSERGLRILARGPAERAGRDPRTLYSERQFVSVTGERWPGSALDVRTIDAPTLEQVYSLIGKPTGAAPQVIGCAKPLSGPAELPAAAENATETCRVFRWLLTATDELHASSFGLQRPDPSHSDWCLALRGLELGLDVDTVAHAIGWRRRHQRTAAWKSATYAHHTALKAQAYITQRVTAPASRHALGMP